jgi:hypothetical protein
MDHRKQHGRGMGTPSRGQTTQDDRTMCVGSPAEVGRQWNAPISTTPQGRAMSRRLEFVGFRVRITVDPKTMIALAAIVLAIIERWHR